MNTSNMIGTNNAFTQTGRPLVLVPGAASGNPAPKQTSGHTTFLHVIGTRPNFVKMAPIVAALAAYPDIRQVVVHTGQHYDRRMSEEVLADLNFPEPDVMLGAGGGSHGEQTAKVLTAMERVLLEYAPVAIVVAGDVNSTLAARSPPPSWGSPSPISSPGCVPATGRCPRRSTAC